MSFEVLLNIVTGRFAAEVSVPLDTLVVYPNEEVKEPRADQQWVRLSVVVGTTERSTFGSAVSNYRTQGIFIAQVFAPLEIGLGEAFELADVIAGAFRASTYSGVRFRTPTVNNVGIIGNAKHWQINVECPFVVDNFF